MKNRLPDDVYITDVQIKNKTHTSVTESFSGIVNVKNRNVQWWEIKFTSLAVGQQTVRELEAFADSLNGRYGTFYINVGNKGKPLKRIRGSATAEEQKAGNNLIKVNGITGTFSNGDFIKFANHEKVYRIINYDRSTNHATIQPSLRKSVQSGDAILYDDIEFKVRMKKDDVTYDYQDSENILEVKFDVREDLN